MPNKIWRRAITKGGDISSFCSVTIPLLLGQGVYNFLSPIHSGFLIGRGNLSFAEQAVFYLELKIFRDHIDAVGFQHADERVKGLVASGGSRKEGDVFGSFRSEGFAEGADDFLRAAKFKSDKHQLLILAGIGWRNGVALTLVLSGNCHCQGLCLAGFGDEVYAHFHSKKRPPTVT